MPEEIVDLEYLAFADRLLFLYSFEDMRHAIASHRALDVERLRAALGSLESDGSVTERELIALVLPAIEELLYVPEGLGVGTAEARAALVAAFAQHTLLGAYEALRERRAILTPAHFDDLRERVLERGPRDHPGRLGLPVLCALGVLLGGAERLMWTHLLWGSHCDREGRPDWALRHYGRADSYAAQVGDARLRLTAATARAAAAEGLEDFRTAADAYAAVVASAETVGDAVQAFDARRGLAGVLRTTGRPAESVAVIDAAIAYLDELGVPTDWEIELRNLRGLVLEDLGRYEQGEAEYTKVGALAQQLGDRERQFVALNNRAGSALKRGQPELGVRRFLEILRMVEAWGHANAIASTHNNLGLAYLRFDRPADALRHYQAALPLKAETGDRRGELLTLVGIGDALRALGDHEAAKALFSMATIAALEMGDIQALATSATHLAENGVLEPDDAELIEASVSEARRQQDQWLVQMFVPVLAGHRARTGDRDGAIALYREALEGVEPREAEASGPRRLRIALGRLLGEDSAHRDEAFELLRDVLAGVQRELAELRLDARRAEVISDWIEAYEGLITLLVHEDDERSLAEAFELHESAKSQSFVASLADAPLQAPAIVPDTLAEREAQLLAIERELQEWSGGAGEAREYRLRRLADVHSELADVWERIEPSAPAYVRLRRGEPASLDDAASLLRAAAREPTALVSLFCGTDTTVAFVLRNDRPGLQAFAMPVGRDRVADVARSLRRQLNGDPTSFPPLRPIRGDRPFSRDLSALEALGADVLAWLPAVEGVELVCVAPHGPLHLIPFHALRTPDGAYLAQQAAVVYAPSATALSYCLARTSTRSQHHRRSAYVAGIAARDDEHPEFLEHDDALFDASAWDVASDLGVAATKAAVRAALPNQDVVHLTCHGLFNEGVPLESGLLLGGGDGRPPRDPWQVSMVERSRYVLTARDILESPLSSELVTLRACSTGLGRERQRGDELEGLTRSLLYAGTASVIAALWNVDQRSSGELVARFYRHLSSGGDRLPKWRALWEAQQELFYAEDNPHWRHPYHWAPLVLIGDWR